MAPVLCVSRPVTGVVSSQSVPQSSQRHMHVAPVRRDPKFPPSIWGDQDFSAYSKNIEGAEYGLMKQEIQVLKADVRKKLEAVADKPLPHLKLIADIEGLGLGYHFEEEMEEAMGCMFEKHHIISGTDLYHTSLYFKLLRQHGYRVSSDIFTPFVDWSTGMIEKDLVTDVKGLLGFFEAAQLGVHGDVILDQALLTPHPNIRKAFKLPSHKNIPRLRTRRYISTYGEGKSHDTNLLKLAKLDFNLLQKHHQQELSQLIRWWKELDMASKCSLAKDRLVEMYMWSVSLLSEPKYELARLTFTKVTSIITIVDDMYDAFGTPDEIDLFTEAIARWDKSLFEQMPEYMKATYKALLDVVDQEIGGYVAPMGQSYRIDYLRKVLQIHVKAYYDEYIWLKNSHVPTMEEYMRVAMITSGARMITTATMAGLGVDEVTKESFEWVLNNPKMLTACSIIARLRDDVGSHKFEQERWHIPSAVECYMNQYGVSEEEIHKLFNMKTVSSWKDINESCLRPKVNPPKVMEIILNFARIIEVFYADATDGNTHTTLMKDQIASVLIHPIPI